MQDEPFAYGRDAFAFVDTLERMSSPDDVMDGMHRVLGRFGIEFFCFNDFPQPNQDFEEVMWACRVPPEWLKLYLESGYAHHDPSLRMCRKTVRPFEYREVEVDPEYDPRAAEVMRRVNDFGLDNGLLVPIPGPRGCLGNVWVGGYRAQFSARTKPAIHLMALYAFDRLRGLTGRPADNKAPVTAREREVLNWTARGKSAWEVGEILKISKRTVDEHVQTVLRKLGAANRTHAVAIALRDHIIDL